MSETASGGESSEEIAGRLYLSVFTIKRHLCHAYKALWVHNRTEAARMVKRRYAGND